MNTSQYYAPDFEVRIQGLTMEADVKQAVISLTYDNNLEQADMFQVVLNNADLRLTDSPLFSAGKDVEIHMGYVGNLKPMMLGEIVAVESSFPVVRWSSAAATCLGASAARTSTGGSPGSSPASAWSRTTSTT